MNVIHNGSDHDDDHDDNVVDEHGGDRKVGKNSRARPSYCMALIITYCDFLN